MAQISIKETLAKVLQWIKQPLVVHSQANSDAMYKAERTDTNTQMGVGVGSDGINHGIYSTKLGKWLIYGDASNVYVNGLRIGKDSVVATKVGSYITSGQIKAYHTSGVITVYFENVTLGTISTSMTTIANIPTAFRPLTQVYGNFYDTSFNTFYVAANGDVKVRTTVSGKSGLVGMVTYVAWYY